ncbi:hypothetical protein VKT23_010261 [Stygiomarasmius scandens]|uniref:Uncharacterized protein n=1 Tax=Marasmiellus scandens TaxID=2682957 RepID=A0ABR1JFU2_9AGAR
MPRSQKRRREKAFRSPAHLLLGDINSQPRSSLKSFSITQNNSRNRSAFRLLEERERKSAEALLQKTIQSSGPETDDRIHVDAYRDIHETPLDDSDSSNSDTGDTGGHFEEEEWMEEELTYEEKLLYDQARDAYQSFDFKDYRNRKDKIVVDQQRWDEELPRLVDAYLDYCYRRRMGGLREDVVTEYHLVKVYSIFATTEEKIARFQSDVFNNESYIRQGYLPFNPLLNKTLVTLETIELYHHLFMRCPRLGIQTFIKALCDLQGIRFNNYLAVQTLSAYDLYIRIINEVRRRVREVLGRDSANWRMLNACPCCQYPVIGEGELPIGMLIAVDGNNSLKRMERREKSGEGEELGMLKERLDLREGGTDYFLSNEEVNRWDQSQWHTHPGFVPNHRKGKKVPCADRFSNMNNAKTMKEFGIFSETGIFIGLCRHRFVLKILDMMRSGEQSKYVLAFLNDFLSATREDRQTRGLGDDPNGNVGVGYDIACNLIDMIARSPLKDLASKERLQMLIGLLHAYAHNRQCQLLFLLIYIYGAGNEDLEVCERFFSQSNALAPITRYQSRFHRCQSIAQYAYHQDNFEAYAHLSKFLYGNYKQALQILSTKAIVVKGMKENKLLDMSVFENWLKEEQHYLESRKLTPEEDTLTMDYYNKLVEFDKCETTLADARKELRVDIWEPSESRSSAKTEKQLAAVKLDREIRRAQEKRLALLDDLQLSEARLKVERRWKKDSEEWRKAEKMVQEHRYQKALDKLEGLIIARMFELQRLNLAGTGYKMRQHIGAAMKNRSETIRKALDEYNAAAALLNPPRPGMEWKDIVGYSYLSEFDFLRDTRTDVRQKPWAKPALRQLMTQAFKLLCSEEELCRLHVEVKRLLTYMKEEEAYLNEMQRRIHVTDPALSFQLYLHSNERGRFNDLHRMRLRNITKLRGFDRGNLHYFTPGIGVRRQMENSGEVHMDATEINPEDKESEGEEEEEEANNVAQTVLGVANDV